MRAGALCAGVAGDRAAAPWSAQGIERSRRSWSAVQRLKNDVLYWLAAAAMRIVARLPLRIARRVGRGVGLLGLACARRERRKAKAGLMRALPELSQAERRRIARECFARLGLHAAEVCQLPRIDVRRHVKLPTADARALDDALAEGRGVVWVTAHLGNWELMAAMLAARGHVVRPIAKPSYDPRLTRLVDRFRRAAGVQTIWRGQPDVADQVRETLGQGAILGILLDQDTRAQGVFVPFFGSLAWTPCGAAQVARESGAPVVAGFIADLPGGGHEVRCHRVRLSQTGDPRQDDAENTARLTRCIEDAIRRQPEGWVWMHERWSTRPPAERPA